MNDNTTKGKVISIRITDDEWKQLDELAKEHTDGNRTAYILQKCFQNDENIKNTSTILEFTVYLKKQLIALKKGNIKKKMFILDLNERIKTLWQSLK